MPEKIAVVGPRQGADLEAVKSFCAALYAQDQDAILVSGGADGVDTTAETEWLSLGGEVWSFRIKKLAEDKYGIEKWELGGEKPMVYELVNEPTWLDPVSALYYRSLLVLEVATRVVAFHGTDRMRGTEFTTMACREAHPEKPLHIFRDGAWV